MADLLIVDDDHDAVETLADLLRSEGHEVRIAHEGREGLVLVYARKPDLLVLLAKPFGLDAFFQLLARALVEGTAPNPRLPTRNS